MQAAFYDYMQHRCRSDWNSGGTHGGTFYKSPAVEAKKHIFLHCNASNLVLKILQHDKIWGGQCPAPNSGGIVPRFPMIYAHDMQAACIPTVAPALAVHYALMRGVDAGKYSFQ